MKSRRISILWALRFMLQLISFLKRFFFPRSKERIVLSFQEELEIAHLKSTEAHNINSRFRSGEFSRVFLGPRRRTRNRDGFSPVYYLVFKPREALDFNATQVARTWTKKNLNKSARNHLNAKMKCWVQFLSTPTADTPGTTLLLHFDSQRYLIGNIAEGTQRACVQRKISVAKVGNIFLTGRTSWANAGGLLGMILTLADSATNAREEKNKHAEESNKKNGASKTVELERQWLNIHGGKNLTHMLATARRFVFRKGMPLYTTEFRAGMDQPKESWAPTWQDDKLKVWSMVIEREPGTANKRKRSHDEFTGDVPIGSTVGETEEELEDRKDQMRKSVLSSMFASDWRLDALVKKKLSEVERPTAIFRRNSQGKISKYNGPTLDEDPTIPDIDVLVRNPWPGAMIQKLPETEPSTASVCYIIKNFPQRGKFNAKAAKDLGVKPGKDFGKLSEGQTVTTESGKVVTPDQVMGKTKEGGGFAIVDLPDRSYIAALIARQEWTATQVMEGVGAVVWLLGPNILEDLRIQKFMQENSKLQHIVSSKDTCSNHIALESPASAAIRLHLLDSERFPIPKHSNEIPTTRSDTKLYTKARTGLTLQLEPKLEIQTSGIISYLDTEAVVKETPQEVIDLADEARRHLDTREFQAELNKNQEDMPGKDVEVCTLGTGSALPSKYRNVSATLLRVPGSGSYLFDCGENTLGQLKRVYGDELPAILRDLKVIWISHLHADHHLGTASVIKAWAEESEKDNSLKDTRLMVASEDGMLNWLREYALVEDYGWERVKNIHIRREQNYKNEFGPDNITRYGLKSITACPVQHCNNALAVVFEFPNGFKVAYSGDCRPSEEFASIGKGATLLIHEATFDDELKGDAIAKKHSTTSEALDVGRKMGARRILLTHFSQRYQKIPVMDSHGGKDQVAIVAFDYMKVKVGDFAKIEAFKPALMKLYEQDEKGKRGEDDD